jgi:cysteate synthase
VDSARKGIWKYAKWLPVRSIGDVNSGPITYRSKFLARELGLPNLFISFNGYWPEIGAKVRSCTFKEYEALVTFQRIIDHGYKGIYLASAGNTARAFAQISQKTKIPSIIFVPEQNVKNLWTTDDDFRNIKLVTLNSDSDYTDAIQLAANFSNQDSYVPEGGARNVARRDGMSTVMYDFVYRFNVLPDYYFQGVGSGTGAISVWEASKRFLSLGKYGNSLPILQLGQNHPYDPMVMAWKQRIRNLEVENYISNPREKIKTLVANMLSNRTPPYAVPGGLFDALTDTNGDMYSVTNNEILQAGKLFEDSEGIDIVPEAAVAVASLIQAINKKRIDISKKILVNITGGGFKRLKENYTIHQIPTTLKYEIPEDIKKIQELFS